MDQLHRRVANNIRAIAKSKKIAVTHLPDRAAVSRSHFFEVMAGNKSPTLQWLGKIASALEVDVADFLQRSGD